MNVQFPDIIRPLMGKLTWRKNTSSKVIYLTFDDGPIQEVTYQVLDILDRYNCKATFFCVGENVKKNPDVYAEILRRGHKTGNHSFNHLKGFEFPVEKYLENVAKASEYIDSRLFRPPYGRIKPSQVKALKGKFEIIMWDVITHDYDRSLSPEKVLRNVKRYSRNGSIVVFHDSLKAKDNVLTVLPKAIEFWLSEGYTLEML